MSVPRAFGALTVDFWQVYYTYECQSIKREVIGLPLDLSNYSQDTDLQQSLWMYAGSSSANKKQSVVTKLVK